MTESAAVTRHFDSDYLDRVAVTAVGREYKHDLIALMELAPGHRVVDIGCGPGTDLAALAARVGDGRVTGVDADRGMVDRARRRMAGYPNVAVCRGDAHALPLAGGSVDRARFDRVIQHLADPAQAVAEAARVLRPGGLLVVSEPDWDTLVIDDPDVETSRAYTRYVTHHVVRNAAIGRQLPRLAAGAGLRVTTVVPVPILFTSVDAAETVLRFDAVMDRAVADGAVDAVLAGRWKRRRRTGPFLAALTCFRIAAVRPA